MFSSLMTGHRSPESAYVDIITLSSKEFTSCFVKSLLIIYIYMYIYIYIYIYIYFKQCKNLPSNTIILINFEDHHSDHRFW